MFIAGENKGAMVTRGELEAALKGMRTSLETGDILIPSTRALPPNFSGGTNHCPNSDLSYSTLAATTPGTTPGTAGDTNLEAYAWYWAERGADVVLDAAHALKSSGHSLYAAGEGATPGIPIWNRVDGWAENGSVGATQYDLIIVIPANLVGPDQRWYVRIKSAALNAALVPDDVEFFAGIWQKTASGQEWVYGGPFDLSYQIAGTGGATLYEYRVLARTDSGVSILSNVLSVPDGPVVLSTVNYPQIFFNAGPGFIEYVIYRKTGGSYAKVHTIRNSNDLMYNDTGAAGISETGWPPDPGNPPLAYAETKSAVIGAFQGSWAYNDLTIYVPATYDFSLAEAQYLRIGLTNPTGVNRHLGLDRIWFSTTFNSWAPDVIRLSDGSAPTPSISPTSGNQGGGGGVFTPPSPGSGGYTCVTLSTPVLTEKGWRAFKQVRVGSLLKGERRTPYLAIDRRVGAVAEYYVIRTGNGITLECSAEHPLIKDLKTGRRVRAKSVRKGMRLAAWVNGRKRMTTVVEAYCVPSPVEVGTFTLRHPSARDGDGLYIAGHSKQRDRGLFCHNNKSYIDQPSPL